MVSRAATFLFFAICALGHAVEIRVATFNIGAHLVIPSNGGTAYFDYGLGDPGTPDYDNVLAILARINADVVALQEIHSVDVSGTDDDVDALAAALGYPHRFVSPTTNTFDTSLRVIFLSRHPFLTTTAVGSPAGAKEITRLFPTVKIDVPGTTRDPLLISAHLKSGTTSEDRFRRAVEMRRLTDYLGTRGLTPDDNYVVMGDFNLSSTNKTFTELPTGLPSTFSLGADILLPVTYSNNPLSYFSSPAVARLDPRQLDNSPSTYQSGSVIDLFLVSPAIASRPLGTEIYNSTLDTSNIAGLPKSGSPLAAETSTLASDHYALFADFELDASGPYLLTAPGQTVSEAFTGFDGTHDPPPWATTGGVWQGSDSGDSNVAGFRSYGTAGDGSLGVMADAGNATATAGFTNGSSQTLTSMRIDFTAEQWRAALAGRADTLTVELVVNEVATSLPALSFSAATNLPSGAVAGGTSTARSAIVTGLAVAPGATFELRFTAVPGPGGGVPPSDVFVNEFHYDNASTDANEFIEIVVAPGYAGLISDISIVLYNGSDGANYGTHALSTFTVGDLTLSKHQIYSKLIPGIQNGDPDGIAIVAGGVVKQFISYGGSFTATAGAANGMISTDIGIKQTTNEVIGQAALGLTGIGGALSNFNWTKFTGIAHSPGQTNSGQDFVNPALPPQGIAIDNLSVTFLLDTDGDGAPDVTDPDDDNDGSLDADEWVFGTDPLDAASRFAMTFAYPSAAPGAVRITFPTATGRTYVVECSPDLSAWTEVADYPGTGSPRVVDLPVIPEENARFYRIRAMLP